MTEQLVLTKTHIYIFMTMAGFMSIVITLTSSLIFYTWDTEKEMTRLATGENKAAVTAVKDGFNNVVRGLDAIKIKVSYVEGEVTQQGLDIQALRKNSNEAAKHAISLDRSVKTLASDVSQLKRWQKDNNTILTRARHYDPNNLNCGGSC